MFFFSPSHEHHLLPPGEKVLVVVSEKETSSIIAYTLRWVVNTGTVLKKHSLLKKREGDWNRNVPAIVSGIVTGDVLVSYWRIFISCPASNSPRSQCKSYLGPVSFSVLYWRIIPGCNVSFWINWPWAKLEQFNIDVFVKLHQKRENICLQD